MSFDAWKDWIFSDTRTGTHLLAACQPKWIVSEMEQKGFQFGSKAEAGHLLNAAETSAGETEQTES